MSDFVYMTSSMYSRTHSSQCILTHPQAATPTLLPPAHRTDTRKRTRAAARVPIPVEQEVSDDEVEDVLEARSS
jgi:hypothetical protein